MFTLLAMIDAAGKIIGGPLMAALYNTGMDSMGRSAGFCFLTASVRNPYSLRGLILIRY